MTVYKKASKIPKTSNNKTKHIAHKDLTPLFLLWWSRLVPVLDISGTVGLLVFVTPGGERYVSGKPEDVVVSSSRLEDLEVADLGGI